jgi:hypothetical protein
MEQKSRFLGIRWQTYVVLINAEKLVIFFGEPKQQVTIKRTEVDKEGKWIVPDDSSNAWETITGSLRPKVLLRFIFG